MNGNFEVIIKIMQNQIQSKNSFPWKLASKFIEFAFEEGGLRPFGRENQDEENLENGESRKLQKGDDHEQDEIENSYEPSNEVIDFQKTGVQNQPMQIVTSGQTVNDEVSHTCVFLSKHMLPTFSINLNESGRNCESNGNGQKSKYVELLLGEKSHNIEYQKYKIIKGGIRGIVRQKIKNQSALRFEKIRFNYISNPQKLPRLILVLYQQNQNKRIYKSVMISDQFSVIENHKILTIENNQNLKPYFELIQTHFLEKTSGVVVGKINTLNKHKILQQMSTFQNYLIKKNKKIWNIVYAAYKYSHIIDLYFYNPENKNKKDQFIQLWKQVIESLRTEQHSDSQKTCNYLHPSAKFVLKINSPMRNVRFIVNKQYSKNLSIISSEGQFDTCGKWVKFDNYNEMKEVYIGCQSEVQAKIANQPLISKVSTINISKQSTPVNEQKKLGHHSKNDDEDFNEQDLEDQDDDVQYQGESSQNYSLSNRKRGRKLGQKKTQQIKKPTNGYTNRELKYTTRGGIRRGKQDTQDSNEKKNNLNKKIKQKQSINRINLPPTIGAPPFRVLNPIQAGQYKQQLQIKYRDQQTQSMEGKMIGIIPMVMGKKPEDNKPQGGPMAMPKGVVPVMMPNVGGMNPQMMAMMGGGMPAGMQMMPLGNGMQAVMMPMQMDKGQQSGQSGMPTLNMAQMSAMGAMGGMGGMPNMGGMNMIPFMMGGGGNNGMPQGFMMPMMPQAQSQNNQASEKAKQAESDKQKSTMEKKEDKKESFPPQAMPVQQIDLSKMGMIQMPNGGIGMIPNGQMGSMQMPQMMQGMGMGGMGMGGMLGGSGMPQGIMMNPMMLQKPQAQSKQQGGNKNMQNPLFGGMPFMMGQMPQMQQMSSTDSSQNPSGMQLGMMGQFPMMQMGQAPQMSGSSGQSGMPLGYTMLMNPEQLRSMNPAQAQQLQQQMQMMMMSKSMMPAGMMQMPKNDQNDSSKK